MDNLNTSASGDPELIDLIGGRLELVARMGPSDTDVAMFRTRMAAGKQVPLHSHIDPECFHVLSGEIEVFVVNEVPRWQAVQPGHSLLVADGVKHAVRNASDHPADLVVLTNNRLARYFREADSPGVRGTEPSPPSPDKLQRMVQVSQAYSYWLASPDESAAITG